MKSAPYDEVSVLVSHEEYGYDVHALLHFGHHGEIYVGLRIQVACQSRM